MAKAETDFNFEVLDVCIDQIFDCIDKMSNAVDQLETTNVPQTAAKDKMAEIIERALKPYMAEISQCAEVFEQGIE
jgi:hypothetical protein